MTRGLGRMGWCAATCAGWLVLVPVACRTPPPEEPPESVELHPLAQVNADYWAQGDGDVRIEDASGGVTLPGRVRVRYSVGPEGGVEVQRLFAWMEDVEFEVPFLWWSEERIKLRCPTFRNEAPLSGQLTDGTIEVAAGAQVVGTSFDKRNSKGECAGATRAVAAESPGVMSIVHNPEEDLFEFGATFAATHEDQEFSVSISVSGGFLNRPPVAAFEVQGDGVELNEFGCPGVTKEIPPIAVANAPGGLEVNFVSQSYDPDGRYAPGSNPKLRRIDVAFEQWARSVAGELEPFGAGESTGPLLFETGSEHQVLLWITDRQGAEARKFCHFQVVEAS